VNSLSSGVAQWFRRSDDGAGLGLHTLKGSEALRGRVLEADAFPPLFIATTGMNAAHTQLVHDYHAWQAPWILLLPHLDHAARSTLETAACQQAEMVEKHCRLYPHVINQAALQAARVEAAFIRNQPAPPRQADATSTEYIELNVSEE
jgi:hypothetical protein